MSELSYLEKLLDGVEVEWKAVGDIAGYSTTKVDADKLDATSFVGVDNLLADKGGRIDATYQPNTARLTAYEPGDILLGNIRPYLKKVWMAENNGGCSGDVLAIRILADCKKIISPEYLYYALSSDSFFSYSMQHAKGAKMPRGSKDAILNYQIPIPCPSAPEKSLAIQSEIVRILDKFTALTAALTAELTAELNMRKKQYNYYRDQLLNLEGRENTREMRIGDIYDFQYGTGNTIPKSGGQYPVYGSNGIVGSHDKYNSEDSPVIGHIGAYAGIVNWGQGKHFVTYNGVICRHKSKEVLQKYAYYLLLLQDFGSKSNSASQPFVSYNILNAPIVLVPPLQEQARIVEILDKFDTLTNSITEGLPREIELRQKQYEYYRDLLFSFPKPETVSN
ncbi:restriction endonuclease subunit S [Escherichia coli]|nr:restriction endonuclease subunit S [Escherichia coli]MBZ8730426.1 restriction endonuclease subunit S [Escherichia coli]MBZ8737075.1 restriction endonuclease subunit S [Escherichia coli]MBZ8740910.1 restriction endonuclease subunit S [Escherichia coli]MBZ8745923.1 restriction endonuclease subunit S [Escherichia coli]